MPRFSIVTVVRNDVAGLRKTRASIASQTCKDLEWLVVDGDSSDGTVQAARGFDEPYVSFSSEPDDGIFDAMNRGLDRASGDYLLFLNAGDTIASPSTLQRVADRLSAGSIDLLYGDSYEAFGGPQLLYKPAKGHRRLGFGMFACHQSMYYRRSWVGGQRFDPCFRIAGDYCFTARLLGKLASVERVDDALCVFDRKGVSSMNRRHGRRENWRIQRDVLRLTWLHRCTNQVAYLAGSMLSTVFPQVYKVVRFRRDFG